MYFFLIVALMYLYGNKNFEIIHNRIQYIKLYKYSIKKINIVNCKKTQKINKYY
jgi:hypothetical protein